MQEGSGNPLREVRVVKRWALLIITGSLGALLPVYALALDLSLIQLALTLGPVAFFVFGAVELVTRWEYRMRRRYAYPHLLAYQLAAIRDFPQACEASVQMVGHWLRVPAAVVAWLQEDGQDLEPVAAHGLPAEWLPTTPADSLGVRSLRQVTQRGQVLTKPSAAGDPWFGGANRKDRVIYVPLVSQGRPKGLLALLVNRSNDETKDRRLLSSLGMVLALALDNCRLYESEREGARRLQQINRMKSDFLITVSHELRTPLTSIKTAAEMLLEEEEKDEPDGIRARLVRNIVKGAARLSSLVADLVNVSREDEFSPRLELDEVSVGDLVSNAAAVIQPLIAAKRQTLELHIPQPEPKISVDRRRFEQVLLNLLSNAHRHTPAEGRVTVQVWEAKGEVIIAITDSGPGVPEQEREIIFEPFFRGDRSGLGLGLAIAKSVVELHNGRIWVESARPSGSTFCVALASRRPEPSSAVPSATATA